MIFTPFAFVKSAGTSFNADAQAFFDAVSNAGGTLTDTEKSAVNTLVIDLQGYSIWNDLQAIYPLVGGSNASTKFNLKDPRDLDAAYRINWAGAGWTFNSSGVQQSNSSTTFGNTFYAQNTNNNTDGMSMGVYINAGTNAVGYDLGAFNGTDDVMLAAGYGNNLLYVNYRGTSYITYTGATMPNGFFVADNDGTTTRSYLGGGFAQSGTESRLLTMATTIYIGNRNGGGAEPTDRRYAFAFLGKSLNATKQSNLYTAVQTFNTTLGRQV